MWLLWLTSCYDNRMRFTARNGRFHKGNASRLGKLGAEANARKRMENPSEYIPRPEEGLLLKTIHPYYFGDTELKRTSLWLRGLPRLTIKLGNVLFGEKELVKPLPKWVKDNGKKVFWCESLISLPKSERARARSKTFPGIAEAMAKQWG